MATTPEELIDLENLVLEDQPTYTWWREPKTGRIVGTTDGLAAMRQAVEVILFTNRFQWPIYTPYFGMEWDGLIGQDPGYIAAELQRRMKDAFSVDNRITGIESFSYAVNEDTLTASVTVNTVYGNVEQGIEVKIK